MRGICRRAEAYEWKVDVLRVWGELKWKRKKKLLRPKRIRQLGLIEQRCQTGQQSSQARRRKTRNGTGGISIGGAVMMTGRKMVIKMEKEMRKKNGCDWKDFKSDFDDYY